jgi:hypothetical protein
MNREDIIRMAREAGARLDKHNGGFIDQSVLLRFASLVAAAEREACAMVCEEVGEHSSLTPLHCAESIKARSKT